MSADLEGQLRASLDALSAGESMLDLAKRRRAQEQRPVLYRIGEKASSVFNRHLSRGEKIVPLRRGFGAIRKPTTNTPPPRAA